MRLLTTLLGTIVCFAPIAASANGNVHVSRHWHLHQPIYWPEWNSNGNQTQRYQYGWDSLQIKFNNGNRYDGSTSRHPQNNLVQGDPEGQFDAVFSPDDRTKAYQGGPKESLSGISDLPFAGYSMSYSGSLIENINSFGRNNAYGYSPNWNQNFIDIRNWRNQSGQRRHDLVGFTYHHSFGPLIPKSVLRKELQIFKEIYWKTWSGQPDKSDHSKGFWPSEAAFSRHMIDVLVDEGYEWTIVANSHLSRTTQNFNEVAGLGNTVSNIDPPNRADRLGPPIPANQWWSGSLDGRGAWQAAPFAYQAHKAQYVNPSSGQVKKITLVPMDDVISYQLGYGSTGTGTIAAEIEPFATDPNRPVIVLVSTDGENAWGGGYDSWQNATPGFLREAHGRGYEATVIQKFLDDHPVPESATVHIEDGSWFNAANDWGHPQFVNWLYPPVTTDSTKVNNLATRYDFDTPGFSEDFRNWAVLMAGTNWMETAEQIYKELNGADSVQAWRIQEPYQANGTFNNPNPVERGWHIFLGGFDSGFMYYGDSLDDEVKQSLASNRAISQVRSLVESNLSRDKTAPTIFKPQRFPWNPGGRGWGPITLYRPVGFNGAEPWPSEFHIWTHVFDLSDVQSVTLRVRVDNDGSNSMSNVQNETFAGGSEVGGWIDIPMQKRILPRGNPSGNPRLNFFITPDFMADYYFARITNQNLPNFRGKLLDYYVVAVDSKGNQGTSDIQHVFVEDDGKAPQPGTPPASPTGLAVGAVTGTSITLAWNSSNSATGYKIYRNGQQVGTPSSTTFTDTGLQPLSTYSYAVAASNSAGDSPLSASVNGTTLAAPVAPDAIMVTVPAGSTSVVSEQENFTFLGSAGSLFSSGLRWTNNANGRNGTILPPGGSTANGWEWTATVPLAFGQNIVSFSGIIQSTSNQTLTDTPQNYSTFTANSTGGEGFGSWFINKNGTADAFLANNSTNMNVGSAKAWGLWANNGGRAAITRSFTTPMKSGDRFQVKFDNNEIANGGEVGMELRSSTGTVQFGFSFIGGQQAYRVVDGSGNRTTQIGYTSGGLDLALLLGSGSSFTFSAGNATISGNLTNGESIAWIEFFNRNAGAGSNFDFFVGAMTHTIDTTGNQTITQNSSITRISGSNTDGLPNSWWSNYGIAEGNRVASADPDADGFTNAQEHALGTDPTSAASRFSAEVASRSGNSVTINWSSVAGKRYQVQAKADLADSWSDVGSAFTANGTTGTQSVTIPSGSTKHFFRVRLVP